MSLKSNFIIFSLTLPLTTIVFGILKSRYDIIFNSLYAIFCMGTTIFLHKKYSLLHRKTFLFVITFILLSVFAGRGLNLYSHVPYWDKFLHFLSGFVLVDVGKEIYVKSKGNVQHKLLKTMFILSFSVAAAGIWEILEFSADKLLGTSAQNGSLSDTMWDIIAGTLSATIATTLTFKKKDGGI